MTREHLITVCPAGDVPFGFFRRWVWRGVDRRLLPAELIFNPILCYLTGRRRGDWWENCLSAAPWMLVFAAEVAAAVMSYNVMHLGPWLLLVLAELVVLPPLVGIACQAAVFRHYQRHRLRIPFEELWVTELSAREVMFGFYLKPYVLQLGLLRVLTLGSILGAFAWVAVMLGTGRKPMVCDLILLIALLAFRDFVLTNCINLAGALAVRAQLFIHEPGAALARMIRDWIWPAGLGSIVFTAYVSGLILGIYYINDALVRLILVVVLLPTPLLLSVLPGLMRDASMDVFFWVPRQAREWLNQDSDHGIVSSVPPTIWTRWPSAAPPRKRRK